MLVLILLGRCSNPLDVPGGKIIKQIQLPTEPDDPRFDTLQAYCDTRIRFEAVIDKSKFPFQRIPDSMRVGIVTESRKDSIPYREIYSASAVYLNLGTITLPFEATIQPKYFLRYNNARMFIGYIILYVDKNKNKVYDYGETIYGIGEQSVFGFAEGKKLTNLPPQIGKGVSNGPNVMVRTGWGLYASEFTASPDFDATIFKIHIRGAQFKYDVPYPWKPIVALLQ